MRVGYHARPPPSPRGVVERSASEAMLRRDMARVFVAVDLDEELRENVVATARALLSPGMRAVPAHQLHVTLRFLASAPTDDVVRALAALPVRAPFDVPVAGAGTFGRGRVVWLGLQDAAPLERLAADVARVLASFGDAERPFHAHITVGRGKPGARSSRAEGNDGARIPVDVVGVVGVLRVRDVVVYESVTSSGGAVHTPMARLPLRG